MIARLLILATVAIAGCKSRGEDAGASTQPTIESLGGGPRVCFPRTQPDNRSNPPAATRPVASTMPATMPTAHGTAGHWCQLCAAAAQRAAEAGRSSVAASTDGDLMQDLPPR